MNCEQVSEMLSAYFDNELVRKASDEVRAHIEHCEQCASKLHGFEQLRDVVDERNEPVVSLPSWETFKSRLDSEQLATAKTSKNGHNYWKTLAATIFTLAASLFMVVVFRVWQPHNAHSVTQTQLAVINLQPLLDLFQQDSNLALQSISNQFGGKEVSMDQADSIFGRPTYVKSSLERHALPGNAQLVSTRLFEFPVCKCSKGACTCGPSGCHCVACLCERPDGSAYLVLEHCKSQSVSFGTLPVRTVKHGNVAMKEAERDGNWVVSWENLGERLTAIGLRSEDEIDAMIATN